MSTVIDIIHWTGSYLQTHEIVEFPPEVWNAITDEDAQALVEKYGAHTMMKLPPSDIEFFEWLKATDPAVWRDLWETEADAEDLDYTVGLALLPELRRKDRGFPICDLLEEPNFHFTSKHFRDEDGANYLKAVQQRFENKEQLSPAHIFALEIQRYPIDIWRFAYLYDLEIEEVKGIVYELVEGGVLEYTPTKDELSQYLE